MIELAATAGARTALLHRSIQLEIIPLPKTEIYLKLELKYINIAHQEVRSPREARGTLHEYCKQIFVRFTFATFI